MKTLTYREIGDTTLVLIFNLSEYHEITCNNPNYSRVLTFVRDLEGKRQSNRNGLLITDFDYNSLEDLISPKKQVERFLGKNGELKISDGFVMWNDEPLHGVLVERILRMMDEGRNVKPLVNFLKNLQENPSYRVREQLYSFLEHGQNAITPDGHFLAYKYVTQNYKSVFDGTTDHSIGTTVKMDRTMVDDDPNRTCSAGLHCCAVSYLGSYTRSYRIVCVKVNPRDVVAVPTDYNNTKMRCCQYQVVSELSREEIERDVLGSSSVCSKYECSELEENEYDFHINDITIDYFGDIIVKYDHGNIYEYNVPRDIRDIIEEELICGTPFNEIYRDYLEEECGVKVR